MRTLVAMLSTGRRDHLTDISFPRLARWASRNDYSCVLIKEPLHEPGRLPHYGKLMVPQRFRDFDVYAIVDDDLLVSGKAPPLPAIPEGEIGLARDAVQTNTHNAAVEWTGNTGFVVVGPNGADLLLEAYETGDDPSVWGIADQGALNAVAWRRKRVHEIDQRWNFAPILTYFVSGRGWHTWSTSRRYRASYYLKVAANPFSQERRLLEASWGCHLIRTKTPTFFDRFLP